MKYLSQWAALCTLVLLAGCAEPPEPRDFSAFNEDRPRSILVVPVVNTSTQVDAADNFLATLAIPLAEKGFYVFPTYMVKRSMEDDGLSDADLVHSADPIKLADLFGADAVLFARIDEWTSRYVVLAASTTVSINYRLISGSSGELLWDEQVTTTYSPQSNQSSGNPLADLIVMAVVATVEKAVPSYIPLAHQANRIAFYQAGRGIPVGPYGKKTVGENTAEAGPNDDQAEAAN